MEVDAVLDSDSEGKSRMDIILHAFSKISEVNMFVLVYFLQRDDVISKII